MSSEKQPLFDLEKTVVPNLVTPGSDLHIAAEVLLPPYYEDGHVRFYAMKIWGGVVAWVSFFVSNIIVQYLVRHIWELESSTPFFSLGFLAAILTAYFITLPLAFFIAAMVSGRRRYFCQWFYQIYYRQLPQRVDTYLAEYILAGV